jgi:hypothetical protein
MRANLGKCHWGGFEEAADLMAVDKNKVGWVSVCERHRSDAERDGYHVRELNDEVATFGRDMDEERDTKDRE